jgi:hypothetical protein
MKPKKHTVFGKEGRRKYRHWQVKLFCTDGGTFGRTYTNREKAVKRRAEGHSARRFYSGLPHFAIFLFWDRYFIPLWLIVTNDIPIRGYVTPVNALEPVQLWTVCITILAIFFLFYGFTFISTDIRKSLTFS